MTDCDTINRVLAERVMGWTAHNYRWYRGDGPVDLHGDAWNPMDNIAQAMRVAEKLGLVMALYRETAGNGWYWVARINKGADFMYDSLAEAISRAAYEVVKGEQ